MILNISAFCDPGWEVFENKCFYFSTSSETIGNVSTGNLICKALNPISTLASVASKAELDFILGNCCRGVHRKFTLSCEHPSIQIMN